MPSLPPGGAPRAPRRAAAAAAVLLAALAGAVALAPVPTLAGSPTAAAPTAATSGPPALPAAPPGDRPAFLHAATPLDGTPPPHLDGDLSDPAWARAEPTDVFTQRDPDEGKPATERTEARIVYDDEALYVGIRAHDSEPEKIVGLLTRRDEWSESDWLTVSIDSFGDRRTAFDFEVNPAGVERDVYRFDDYDEDKSWDAVWDVSTRSDGGGWTAEFRIPFSQLRFAAQHDRPWGLQIARQIVRKNELDLWKPIAKGTDRWVSDYGNLAGLERVRPPRRLELLPYTVGGGRLFPRDEGDAFADTRDFLGRAGLDLKYGVTSDITLDATVNPDFGQVEADPSVINLSAFETFFPEKRPFFLEGTDKFQFSLMLGDGGPAERLFYTRRVGRSPQGGADGFHVEAPEATTILGAGKVSGKTAGGWTLGLIEAVTQEERAEIKAEDGSKSEAVVEPLTNYMVGRIARDFRHGETAIGGILTATNRHLDGTGLDWLHSSAYAGGLDVRHRINPRGWAVNGKLALSHVRGSTAAITRTQRSSRRYFQRPDAEHVEVDSSATQLTGSFALLEAGKFSGNWRGALFTNIRSPELEVNDAGFQQRADDINNALWFGHRSFKPGRVFRNHGVNWNLWYRTNFGGEKVGLGGNVNANVQFVNYWNAWAGGNFNAKALHINALRGGPAMINPPSQNVWAGFGSDSRKAVTVEVDSWLWRQPDGGNSHSAGGEVEMSFRIAPNLNLAVGESYDRQTDDWAFPSETADVAPPHIMARIEQRTLGLTTRVNWTFRPNLSLQVYASPFLSAGKYSDFRQVVAPRADRYEDRFDRFGPVGGGRLTYSDGTYHADLDRDGTADLDFGDPDFNFRQLRSSIVLRWEYMAGSTIFFVYQHDRTNETGDGVSQPWNDFRELWHADGNHTVLVKVNYWWSL